MTFKNGSTVQRENEGTGLRVTWPDGGSEYVNEWAHDQLRRAYELALEGSPPPEIRPRPPKRQPPSKDFGACPF